MYEAALEEIKKHETIIIHRHTNPDGDALGSQIGLKHLICASFPGKKVYTVGDEAGRYSFMDDSVMDTVSDSAYEGSLAVILDTGSRSLISDSRYALADRTLRFDHHIFCEKIADTEFIDTSFESCCGLITAFATESGLIMTPAAAKALYTGMITDSGRFRYDSTTAATLRRAAVLLEQPFSTADIYRGLYADDYNMIKLRARYVLKIQFTPKNVAYIYTTADEVKKLGYDTFTLSRGMVNTMGDIRGVDIWVNFTETDEGVLCEIRSARYNINPIAVRHGGGGHAKASGATLKNKEEAWEMLEELNALAGGTV